MINLYSAINGSDFFRKMEVSELLFVEYTCMQEETKFGIWSNNNYFAFISSGKKMWRSIHHSYEVEGGDILFIKKGANLTHQFFDDTFCAVFMFVPHDFIKSVLQKNSSLLETSQKDLSEQDAVLRVANDELLDNYNRSIISFLTLSSPPNKQLLKLKFEELILSLFANNKHQDLTDYFVSLCQSRSHQMSRVMEENFAYNLNLEDYAQLCSMSLSAFKKAFKEYYKATPAAWLRTKKLELAKQKLLSTELNVNQISFECGFEDTSHFIRVFKKQYELTPLQLRQQVGNN